VVTPSAGRNGSIYPASDVTVEHGGLQAFKAFPYVGYRVDTWYVDDAVVQTGGNTYVLTDIYADHLVHVTFKQQLSYSLDDIRFDSEEEYKGRIVNNNFVLPGQPGISRIHVQRVEGLGPDPTGVMLMIREKDRDPTSPTYGRMMDARAKGSFTWTDADEVYVQFKYMFNTTDPTVELRIYISDLPGLLNPDDPRWARHCIEVARLSPPPDIRPGSYKTGRFGLFEKVVWIGSLDPTGGIWIEMRLTGGDSGALGSSKAESGGFTLVNVLTGESTCSGGGCVLVDDWNPMVQCYGICLDINVDNFVNEADFLTVIGECGHTATDARACLDGVFGDDGTVDALDVVSWDWAMNAEDRLFNFCGLPLVSGGEIDTMMADKPVFESASGQLALTDPPGRTGDLLIAGKRAAKDARGKLEDRLYSFGSDGLCTGWSAAASQRCNVRLVRGVGDELYQINSETGVLRLDETGEAIIPPGTIALTEISEPRYNKSAVVYVGIQGEDVDPFGRPILDAAFDADYVYVIPVVVDPDGQEPYTAAAKLQLLDGADPPYQVVQLYDDPPLPADNQQRDALREIELDSAGNVYVLNVHYLNESDIVWRYEPNGAIERLDLGNPDSDSYLPAPIGMYVSDTTNMLYLASARYNPVDTGSTVVYGFSNEGPLTLTRCVTITGMQHVTSITEDPVTGSLLVAGFNMDDIPLFPNPTQMPFYSPYLAKIPKDSNDVELLSLSDPASHDLGLPISMVWTGSVPSCLPTGYSTYNDWVALGQPDCWCTPYQCDGDADGNTQGFQKYRVMSNDLAIIYNNWKKELEDPTLDPCADIDHKPQGFQKYRVMSNDLAILTANWKKTDSDLAGDCPRPE